jgi:hypothetical protein
VSVVTSTQVESFGTLIAAAGVLVGIVLVGGPSLARLLFRSRLEAVHDAAVDAILDGRLQPERSVKAVVQAVDHAAEHARWMTLARNAAMLRALNDLGIDRPTELFPALSYSGLQPSERKLMHDLEERTYAAVRSYMIWGSPLGWVLAPFILLMNFQPGKIFTKTNTGAPAVAREAMCVDSDTYRRAARWVSGTRSCASR